MKRSAAGGRITRVRLRNYKSIAICSVDLAALTIMVGPNGAGKSNFLDGLSFTAEALRYSVDHAMRERGGIDEVRRRNGERLGGFAIRVDLRFAGATGWYGFEIRGTGRGRYVVRREECVVRSEDPERCGNFRVCDGSTVTSSISKPPPSVGADRLYLLPASAYGPFRPVYDALSAMAFYNFDPVSIRDLQAPDSGDLLERSGMNVASVLDRLKTRSPASGARIAQYLAAIVPGLLGVEPISVGPRLTVEFREQAPGEEPRRFLANSMSDGTLHVLGMLVALFQRADGAGGRLGLIGIEETGVRATPCCGWGAGRRSQGSKRAGAGHRHYPQRRFAGPGHDRAGIDPGRGGGARRDPNRPARRDGPYRLPGRFFHRGRAAADGSTDSGAGRELTVGRTVYRMIAG